MSNEPQDETGKPSPQAQPSTQPAAQPKPQPAPQPQERIAPYTPIETKQQNRQGDGFSQSRRTMVALLAIVAASAVAGGYYLLAPQAPTQTAQPVQPLQPITAAPVTPGCPLIESASAEITIEEFTDFACPYCARFSDYLENMKRDFGPRIRIVYRSLPRPAHGPIAETAARAFAAVCMQNPAMAYPYYSELLAHQNSLYTTGEPFLYDAASKFNINIDRMKSDMASQAVADQIEQDKIRAKQSGLILSPSWIIGTKGTNGTYDYAHMQKFIQDQLNHK